MKRSQNYIDENVLKKVYEDVEHEAVLYVYNPTLLRPFYYNMEPMRFVRRVRLLGEYLHKEHYKVYYLAIRGELVGYNVISPGGRRLSFSSEKDIVSGPAYIDPKFRNKGYNKLMKRLCFEHCENDYEYVYNWVDKTNIPSIKSVEKMGFEKVGELNVVGIRYKLIDAKTGTCNVYRLANPKKTAERQ